MKTGVVKWFNAERGYGFIDLDGQDVFVHHTSIEMAGFRELMEGDIVTFDTRQTDKGTSATHVKLEKR